MIKGLEFEGQVVNEEEKSEKRMIIRKELIIEIILKMLKGYKSLEYESRRLKLRGVWIPIVEEILSRRGILNWQRMLLI